MHMSPPCISTGMLKIQGIQTQSASDAQFRFRNRNRFRNQSHFCWNQNRNQENQIGQESESRIEAMESESAISISPGIVIRNLQNAGIGIKTYPESCITAISVQLKTFPPFYSGKLIDLQDQGQLLFIGGSWQISILGQTNMLSVLQLYLSNPCNVWEGYHKIPPPPCDVLQLYFHNILCMIKSIFSCN